MKKTFLQLIVLTTIVLTTSSFKINPNQTEKQVMLVYILSASETLHFYISIDGKDYKEEEVKRKERRDFNEVINFLKKQYSEGWKLISSNMATGTSYEEFYYMLEK